LTTPRAGAAAIDYVLDATRRAAEGALLDQALQRVGAVAFAAFQVRLDASPKDAKSLRS
jgi:uncharacterized protein (DUF1778 family)